MAERQQHTEQFPRFHSNVPLPCKLNMSGNMSHNWKRWKQVWDSFEIVTNLIQQDHKYRIATFITCIGPDALEIFNGLPFSNDSDRENMDAILLLMGRHCVGATNITYERYIFNKREQEQDENIDTYATHLRALSQTCEFRDLQDELIRDRIVCGVKENGIRRKLLQEPLLTLPKCVDICRASESTSAQVKAMSGRDEDVAYIKRSSKKGFKKRPNDYSRKSSSNAVLKYNCKFCGGKHESFREKCPAYGKTCHSCGEMSHFASKCPSKNRHSGGKPRINKITTDSESEDQSDQQSSGEDLMTVDIAENVNNVDNLPPSKIFATLLLDNKPLSFQIDSGATCNVISKGDLPPNTHISPSDVKLRMYNNTNIQALGKATLKVVNPKNSKKYKGQFVVVPNDRSPLLGSRSAQQMNFIKVLHENILQVSDEVPTSQTPYAGLTKTDILTKYPKVFQGEFGLLQQNQKLTLDSTVTPVKQPVRRIPHAFKDKLKTELNRLEQQQVITPVDKPTDWVSSLVIVKKPSGKLRICIDPKPLNKALKRSHYPLPLMDDILPDLTKAKVFTKLDLKNGFWHIALDEQSSLLTTFGTPYGRYRWLRLPFGVSPAPEIFQYHLDQALKDLPGVFRVADDIMVIGEGQTTDAAVTNHDMRLTKLMDRCQEKSIVLNSEKIEWKQTEVPFIGHLLSSDGLKPDPKKVEAIKNMPKPTDVQGVQRIIGVANYLSKFMKGLSDICEPLRQLTKKDTEWYWTFEHDQAFDRLRDSITKAPVLKYFDSTEDVTLQSDASETGLGATILQAGQPIAFASRALTPTERNYAQIEKELLSILFGFTKFHQYLYGRHVKVESDHKPLESIQKKPLLTAPKRLQRMLLGLQKYDYLITYKKGKEMYLSDTLSRAYLPSKTSTPENGNNDVLNTYLSADEEEIQHIHMSDYLPVTESRLLEIQTETQLDETLQCLKSVIQNGWPDNKSEVPALATVYFHIRDELSIQDGVLFRGPRCVIPRSLRSDILKRLHSSHNGIEATRRRAREIVYWPNMNAEITDFVSKCEICSSYDRKQTKETLIHHDIPERPWSKLGMDILTYNNKDYLVTVDYYSDFFELDKITNKTGKEVLSKLKMHLARHGIPDVIVSDNGPPFNSKDFAQLARKYEFQHVTSSPAYPQSNGKAEAAVKIAKRLIKKCDKSGTDPYLALLEQRNTPTEGCDSSPSQRLFNRRTKTLLPTAKPLLQPQLPGDVMSKKVKKMAKQEMYYNRSTKDLKPLVEGDQVRIQPVRPHDRLWKKGTVLNEAGKRSYLILTDGGVTLRRNRRHLRTTAEPPLRQESADLSTQPDLPAFIPEIHPKPKRDNANQICPTSTITRSGRVSKLPRHLSDFVK